MLTFKIMPQNTQTLHLVMLVYKFKLNKRMDIQKKPYFNQLTYLTHN